MVAPLTASWNNNNLSDSNLDATTHGSGTSDPNPFPTNRPFFRTDTRRWKYTTDGGTTWKFIGSGAQSLSDLDNDVDTTGGDIFNETDSRQYRHLGINKKHRVFADIYLDTILSKDTQKLY